MVGLFIVVMSLVAYMLKQDGLLKRTNSNDFIANQQEGMVIPLLQQQEEKDEESDQEHGDQRHHVKSIMTESPPSMTALPSATTSTNFHDDPISYITKSASFV